MKNLRLGTKIGASYGLVVLIILALGALAISCMLRVSAGSERMAQQYLPEVKLANELERHALLTMYAVQGYAWSEDRSLLQKGRRELELVKKVLKEARARTSGHPELADQRQRVVQAQKVVAHYEKLIDQTESHYQAIAAARELLEVSAGQYLEACYKVLEHQNRSLAQELRSGAPQARLLERLRKITLINDIIDLGNATSISTMKAQALRRAAPVRSALANFPRISEKLDQLRPITRRQEEIEALGTIKDAADSYRQAMNVILSNWASLQELTRKREAATSQVLEIAQATAQDRLEHTQKEGLAAVHELNLATVMMIGGLAAALLLGIILAVLTTRSVTLPVLAAAQAVAKASQGDFRIHVDPKYLERGDELGEMLRNVQAMGEYLSHTVHEVALTADTVAASAQEISRGSLDLADRTQQQASAIQETASAIEEMTSSIKQNAENSLQANDLAKSTAQMAREGGEVVERTVEAMKAVTESSNKIADIIRVVNEIAFQTNLLALNAAVEAARAGEAGRGFAVVAGEVRTLAGRSAKAAKEIQGLINDSMSKVEQSNALASESGRLLHEIIQNVQEVADTVAEITASSQEQARGIEEINRAVIQMDESVQQNAALVEEAASASEQMAAAAEDLRFQVQRFKVEERQEEPQADKPDSQDTPPSSASSSAPPKETARKSRAPAGSRPRKQEEDEFFEVDELDGFEEF